MSDEPPIRLGLRVDDVASAAALYESFGFTPLTARRCAAAPGCTVVADPLDAPWGDRYVVVDDPFGYTWKFFTCVNARTP